MRCLQFDPKLQPFDMGYCASKLSRESQFNSFVWHVNLKYISHCCKHRLLCLEEVSSVIYASSC